MTTPDDLRRLLAEDYRNVLSDLADAARTACYAAEHPSLIEALSEADAMLIALTNQADALVEAVEENARLRIALCNIIAIDAPVGTGGGTGGKNYRPRSQRVV